MKQDLLHTLYKTIAKPLFFRMDPEDVHDRATGMGSFLGKSSFGKKFTHSLFFYEHPVLEQTLQGISFKNPIGLAAGFDKNAQLTDILPEIGFGFEEIGSITAEPCEGNPKPRLWRHPKLNSLRVYYGLKNDGSEAIAKRLEKKSFLFPIGISIAKTNCLATADTNSAIADYLKTYERFASIGDYDTLNISCPNAYGGQPFTDAGRLTSLLQAIAKKRHAKPLFLKLSPDLSLEELDTIATIADVYRVDGFICSNLTKKHDLGNGGLSGKPVHDLSLEQVRYLFKKFHGQKIIIACGGIFCAQDAYQSIKAGAHLLQLITGMIYEGPQLIGAINQELVNFLKKDGYTKISQTIGIENNR